MFLKSIEIFGFKSFPEKIKLNFPRGISALIGPNGCGKSNVVDSLKWVFGEQSTKTLRASRMEDIIFNGTETRKALNVAEVEVTMVNESGLLPLDLPEISIRRRLFRSGESEYYVNNRLVKLKELKELFYDTGIGKSAYSIMEQGRIDQILSNKPEERRYVFEEAAGITKYKIRGQEAERKLEKTEENIRQAETILQEVKRSYDTLSVQAGKTEMYRKLRDEQFNLDIKLRLLKLRSLLEERDNRDKSLDEEIEKRRRFQEEIDGLNASMEKSIDLVNTMESKLIDHQKTVYGLNIEKTNKESQIKLLKDRISELERKIEFDKSREAVCNEKIKDLKEDGEKKRHALAELDKQIREIEKNIADFSRDIAHFSEKIHINDEEIVQKENDNIRAEKEIKVLNNALREITEDIVTQLDQRLKETGYSFREQKKSEESIDGIINTLKIQLEGKSSILADVGSFDEIKTGDIERVLKNTHALLEDLKEKVAQLAGYFQQYKKAAPSFIDEFLSPEGIITKKRDIDRKLTALHDTVSGNNKRAQEIKLENREMGKKIEEYRKTLENLNINKARMQTQKSGYENDIQRILRDTAEQEHLLKENQLAVKESIKSLEVINATIVQRETEKRELEQKEQSLARELKDLEQNISSKNSNLATNEKKLKDKMNVLLSIQSRIEKVQMSVAEINVEIKNVYDNFNEQYSRDLGDYESQIHEITGTQKELRDLITNCRDEIKKCGQVNLMAPEEYQEVKERYDFLVSQIGDLKKAREDLNRITHEIRTESSELFLNTYNQVRKNFHMMFRRLFGGGRAELKLTDPDNVLESGIEIMVQPPGKNLESIELLSGGERSLTGVSLLFATYMVKPSPFCILDEIDAALDEENVNRFVGLLREFSNKSQFIIITHNKKTISGTEALFGITMEEAGVSKIITVRLKESEKQETYA
ncbi:MAG: AAA family ATPase [Spirochaetales bacterium]|nr:AAA family ATPase [Spirochaetales bacterium]